MDPDSPFRHAKHIVRAALSLLVLLVALVIVRAAAVPPSFGRFGHYRGDSVAEYRALEPRHGGREACGTCHEEQLAAVTGSVHAPLQCEICHAPLADHVRDGSKTADMPVPETTERCLQCHRSLAARPASFPQIDPRQHVLDEGGEPGPRACFDCHDAHQPL